MIKNYTITVNGVSYDVTVEENNGAAFDMVPHKTPVASAIPAPKKAQPTGAKGAKKIEAGAAGKVLKIDAKIGDQVKKGQQVLVLEVMKMETPIVANEDGVVASIEIKEGDSVEAGEVLVTLN